MKKISVSIILVLVLVLSTVGIVSAITDGELDGEGHPYVGLMVAKDIDGAPLWRCSGTLISPTSCNRRALHRSPGRQCHCLV